MKEQKLNEIKNSIYTHSFRYAWNFESEEHATLYYCELMLKKFAGYAISHTESALLNGTNYTLKLMRKDGRTPTKLGSELLCEVYYSPSSKKSKGCLWANKYRLD